MEVQGTELAGLELQHAQRQGDDRGLGFERGQGRPFAGVRPHASAAMV